MPTTSITLRVGGYSRFLARTLTVVVATLGVVLAACSSEGDDPSPTVPVTRSPASDASPAAPSESSEQRIVYEARDGQGATNVFTIDPGTAETVQMTAGSGFDGHPAWSPDYAQILFVSDRDDAGNKHDVYVMNADGTDPRPLTATRGVAEWAPKFSPDAQRITYVEVAETGSWLMVMNADGGDPRRIAGPYRFAEFPAWTRDGGEIWFAAIEPNGDDIDIFSARPDTMEVRIRVATPSNDVCPHFSRDGTIMTYAAPPLGENDNMELFAHDIDSTDTTGASDTRLTTQPGFDDYANPSPDGSQMVFLSARDGQNELYLMNPDGSNQRRLTTTPDIRENVPDW